MTNILRCHTRRAYSKNENGASNRGNAMRQAFLEPRTEVVGSLRASHEVCVVRLEPRAMDPDRHHFGTALRELAAVPHVAIDVSDQYLTNDEFSTVGKLRAALAADGRRLAIIGPGETLRERLATMRLDRIIDLYATEHDFLSARGIDGFAPSAAEARGLVAKMQTVIEKEAQEAAGFGLERLPARPFPGELTERGAVNGWEVLRVNAPRIPESCVDSKRFDDALRELQWAKKNIILDLEGVQFMGADAIGSMLRLWRWQQEHGGVFRLCNVQDELREKLHTVAGSIFRRRIYPTLDAALLG